MKKLLIMTTIISFLFSVTATLDKTNVVSGDAVTLTISATGDNIKFPNITKIGPYEVIGTGLSQEFYMINNKTIKNISKSYQFIPTKDLDIPQFSIFVDGKEYKTKKLHLKVIPPTISKDGDNFVFQIKVSKKEAFENEPIILEYIFKYKKYSNLVKVELEPFSDSFFWVKKGDFIKPFEKDNYITQIQKYIIFPKKEGNYNINSKYIKVAVRDGFGYYKFKKIYANEINIKVKKAPLDILGDFNFNVSVDKKETLNEPINLTIKIDGYGNINDIDKFNIPLNAIIYSDEPNINTFIKDNKFSGFFTQKISIISDKDFTIPAISFKYYSLKDKKIVIKKSNPIKIKVKSKPKNTKIIENKEKVIIKYKFNYIFLIIGFVIGVIFILVILKLKNKKNHIETPIEKKIKKAKNDLELYKILLPYINNKKIKQYLIKLEENIYNNKKNKIDKKKIIDILEYKESYEKNSNWI